MKINFIILTIGCLLSTTMTFAWDWWPLPIQQSYSSQDTLLYNASIQAITSSGLHSPFWLHTNRNGSVSVAPYSGNLTVGIQKPATCPQRWFDYDFALSITGQLQSSNQIVFPKVNRTFTAYSNLAYAHVRLYIFDITAGIQPVQWGNPDSELTSGGLLFSNNAHPMPKIAIGIDRWTAFPGLYGYVEIRGGISNMWMVDNVYVEKSMLHYKWVGAKIGGKLPINLSYEFHHIAQWGGYSPIYGDLGNNWNAFLNALFIKSGGSMATDQINAQGNHIGSQILTLEIKGKKWKVSAYWQNIFEDGPIKFLGFGMNTPDGLWGINITQQHWPFISGLTYEFIQTTDQSGPFHDKDGFIFGGNDNYYKNGIYQNGWNYWYRTIGNPFITSPIYNTNGTIHTLNNRVKAHFIGIKGDIYDYKYRIMCSYADNYGTNNKPLRSKNTAILIECSKHIEKAWGLDFGVAFASDFGNQFGNQFGALFTITKKGILTTYK